MPAPPGSSDGEGAGGRAGSSRRGSRSDEAYARLREQIVACKLAPGTWVTEARLADELGVGKTPVREALSRLAAEGFVQPSHRRGYQVAPITISGVLQVLETFGLFVPQIGVLVVERAPEEERRHVVELTRAWMSVDPEAVREHTSPFRLFVELTGNPVIVEMTTGVVGHLERLINFSILHGGLTEPEYRETIEAALAAIDAGERDRAENALIELIEATKKSMIGALRESASLMDTPVEFSGPRGGTGT